MLYIRHSEKRYINGGSPTYWLDPDLTTNGIELAHERFVELLQTNPIPSYIVCSPYLRTRQTAEIAQDVIMKYYKILVEIDYDNELSEYLNNRKYHSLAGAFRPDTTDPAPPESKYKFTRRVQRQFDSAVPNVWYITHGLNIYSNQSLIHLN